MRTLRRITIAATALLVVLLLSGAIYEYRSANRAMRRHPAPGHQIEIGTHALHVVKKGETGPAIVLESGAGGSVLDWSSVHDRLAEHAQVYAYDRAGLGWSESGPGRRTVERLAQELHSLLEVVDAPTPRIIVAHSFGGLVARAYAAAYPDEVAGLVLVDSVHEDFFTAMPPEVEQSRVGQLKMLSMAVMASYVGLPRLLFPPMAPPGLEGDAQVIANALGYQRNVYRAVHAEATAFDESAEYIRSTHLPAALPVHVLTRTRPETWPPSVSVQDAEATWADLQSRLAALSTDSKHTHVADSGHYIPIEQPDAVIDAIQSMRIDK